MIKKIINRLLAISILVNYSCNSRLDKTNVSTTRHDSINIIKCLYILDNKITEKRIIDQMLREELIENQEINNVNKEIIYRYGEKARNGLLIFNLKAKEE